MFKQTFKNKQKGNFNKLKQKSFIILDIYLVEKKISIVIVHPQTAYKVASLNHIGLPFIYQRKSYEFLFSIISFDVYTNIVTTWKNMIYYNDTVIFNE